jgi:hypothetical protein
MNSQSNSPQDRQLGNATIDADLKEDLNAFEIEANNSFPNMEQSPAKTIIKTMRTDMKAPAQETEKNLDLLLRNAGEIDERTKDLLIKNRSLIQQLFPSKMDKMVMEMQRNTIQSAMDFRLNLYKMSTQFRLESLREKYNSALMTIRGHYREQVSDFMMSKLEELHVKVDVKQRSFIEFAKEKYDYAKLQAGYPSLQALYLNNINEESQGYLNFLHRQITNFESIIDEQIEKIS